MQKDFWYNEYSLISSSERMEGSNVRKGNVLPQLAAQSWTGPEYSAACGVPREFYHPEALKYYDEHGIKIVEP